MNSAASAPDSVQVTVSPPSTSLRVAVYTAPVAFSTNVAVAALVTAGASFTAVTVIEIASESVAPFASVESTVSVSEPAKLALPW